MIAWLSANAGTITVCALVIIVAALAVRSLIKSKKQGESPCGCSGCTGCSGCPSGQAHNDTKLL